MKAQGLVERGFNLTTSDRAIRIDITGLTGRHVTVYGQTELTRDLMDAAPERDRRNIARRCTGSPAVVLDCRQFTARCVGFAFSGMLQARAETAGSVGLNHHGLLECLWNEVTLMPALAASS